MTCQRRRKLASRRGFGHAWVLLMLAFAWLQGSAKADVVTLVNGRRIEGRAVAMGGRLRLEIEGGVIELPRSQVLRVDPAPTPSERFHASLRRVDMSDPDALSSAGRRARRLGLYDQSEQLGAMARGLRLERQVARLAQNGCAAAYFEYLDSPAGRACSAAVRGYLVERGAALLSPEERARRSALEEPTATPPKPVDDDLVERRSAAARELAEQRRLLLAERRRLVALEARRVERLRSFGGLFGAPTVLRVTRRVSPPSRGLRASSTAGSRQPFGGASPTPRR